MARREIRPGTVYIRLGFGDKWGDLCRAWAHAEVGSLEEQRVRRERFKAILHSRLYEYWTDLMLTGAPLTATDLERIERCDREDRVRFDHEYEDGWIEFQIARENARDEALRPVRRRSPDRVPVSSVAPS
jgi:hypothetical protein